ncbi:MAG TPA: hypothetical protein VGO47_10865, partial [Chlamydiales bacterium]|nr:hypothetical protein [Chlamydiales bacterium]
MQTDPNSAQAARGGLTFLDYLEKTWMPQSLWCSWSMFGRLEASKRLGIPLGDIAPTTNHLEAFNGVLKRKYIQQVQRGGHRLRVDVLIHLLVTSILPAIFEQRDAELSYYEWLSNRFREEAGGCDLVEQRRLTIATNHNFTSNNENNGLHYKFAWWCDENKARCLEESEYIMQTKRIGCFHWANTYTIGASCASSLVDVRDPD